MKDVSSENLRAELKNLADALEDVLSASTGRSKVEIDKLLGKARDALEKSREKLSESGDMIAKNTREAAACADDYVHRKPWHGVGIGAAIGIVIGMLMARR